MNKAYMLDYNVCDSNRQVIFAFKDRYFIFDTDRFTLLKYLQGLYPMFFIEIVEVHRVDSINVVIN